MPNPIKWQAQTGESVEIEGMVITPRSQVLQIRFPLAGFVWQRPTAVTVERDGRTETIPIVDVTRIAVWAVFGLTAVVSFLIYINNRIK